MISALHQDLLAVAERSARAAGDVLLDRFAARDQLVVIAKSSPTDMVSEADQSAEAAIRSVLGEARPDDAILGEEGGRTGDGELEWVVDPLDGTTNFLYGLAAWCVSVAVRDADGGIAGVVFDPLRDELFAGVRGRGATCGGVPLGGRGIVPPLSEALVGTGFGYDAALRERQAAVAATLLPQVRDIRRAGACALDLAWVAAGRIDAFYERGVQPWDIEAGALLCREAGLAVRTLEPALDLPVGILAGPGAVVESLSALVA